MQMGAKVMLAATVPLVLAIAGVMFVGHDSLNEQIKIQTRTVRDHEDVQRKARLLDFVKFGRGAIEQVCKTVGKMKPTDAQLQLARSRLGALDFGADNYFFVYDMSGVNLVHPRRPELQGKNLLRYKDGNDNYVIELLLTAATHNDKNRAAPALAQFVPYLWERPSNGNAREENKLGYAEMMPACGWMIGSGFYLETEQETRMRLSQAVASQMTRTRNQILAVAAAALALATVVAYGLRLNQRDLRRASQDVKAANNELRLSNVELENAERKLTSANGALQITNDELRIANQRISATNDALQAANERLKSMQMQVMQSLEMERERIGSSLHNGLNQSLASVKFIFESGLMNAKHGKGNLADTVNQGVLEIMDTMRQTRELSHELYPTEIIDLGLADALNQLTRMFMDRTKAAVVSEIDSPLPAMDKHVATALFRVVQGGLLNVERHATTNPEQLCMITVSLKLHWGPAGLQLQLQDNGRGFEVQDTTQRPRDGIGLYIMRFSMEMLGGRFEVQSKSGSTTLTAHLPGLPKPL